MLPLALHRFIARLLLAWFALALGVAAASPLVQPRALQLVCSASGAVKLVADADEGLADSGAAHTLDCALCLPGGAPPPRAGQVAAPSVPVLHAGAMPYADAPTRQRVRAPLPARGPPQA